MLREMRRALPLSMLLLCVPVAAQDAPPHTSVGAPRDGRIAGGGVELPTRGPGYHFRTHHQRNNPSAHYGTPPLVGALQRAAAAVAGRWPGSDVAIEDLSFENGGRIRGHGSHRTGRDVDVTYYAMRADGSRIDPTESRWFLRNGRARGHADERLDAERTWAFLRALLEDDAIRVQYVFMHRALQRRILAVARAPARARFADVMRTPRGRNVDPHADHFHVRIECPEADVAFGCRDR